MGAEFAFEIAFVLPIFRFKELSSAAQQHIHSTFEVLRRDTVAIIAALLI